MGGVGNVNYLDCRDGIMCVCICANSSNFTLNVCSSLYVHYTSIKPFKNFWKTILQARWSLMNGEFYQAFKEKNDTKSKWKRKDFLTHSTREALF